MARDYTTQLKMMSLVFLVIAVLLIFFAPFGTRELSKKFFSAGAFLAVSALLVRLAAFVIKK